MVSTKSNLITLIARIAVLLAVLMFMAPTHEAQGKDNAAEMKITLELGGKLVCNVNRKVVVMTNLGAVVCQPNVTVFVFQNEHAMGVYNFDSANKDQVKVIVDKKQIAVRPAEQLVVSRVSDAKFNDINPGLGIMHKKVQPLDIGSNYTAYIGEFSLVSGISKIPILSKMTSSNKPNEKQAIQRILKNAAILQSSAERLLKKRPQPTGTVAQMLDDGKKLAGSNTLLKGAVERFSEGQQQVVDMRIAQCLNKGFANAAGLSWLELAESDWKLRKPHPENPYEVAGIFSCPINTYIKTELGNVECKKGAIVFVVNREDSVSICTLDSPSLDDVNVYVGDSPKLRLAPGRQIVLTKDTESKFEKTNPAHLLGYRDEKEVGTVDGTKIMRADFSIASAMMSIQPLRRLVSSPEPEKNKIAANIMKNSAILWGLTAKEGVFHPTK